MEQFNFTHGASASESTWTDNNATSLFQPTNLHLTRPMRAWERKPTSPFQSKKSRAKKIWKRAPLAQRAKNVNTGVKVVDHNGIDGSGNTKAVKRRCISAVEKVNTQWEAMDSPVKRITTRSTFEKELVALEEDEPEVSTADEDVDGTITEIIHEDGTCTDISASVHEDKDDWLDAQEEDEAPVGHNPRKNAPVNMDAPIVDDHATSAIIDVPGKDTSASSELHAVEIVIPEGFATPMKRHRSVSKRLNGANRRRTLPHAFAPAITLAPVVSHETPDSTSVVAEEPEQHAADAESMTGTEMPLAVEIPHPDEISVQVEPKSPEPFLDISTPVIAAILTPAKSTTPRRSPRRKSSSPAKLKATAMQESVPHIIAFSPVKDLQASRMKQSMEESTLRADEPKPNSKRSASATPQSPALVRSESTETVVPQTPPAASTKQSSLLETKQYERTRLSDDTALLQAFLDRAAQNKTTPIIYADDPDIQSSPAFIPASPAVNILGNLDPNTTSPRRVASPQAKQKSQKHEDHESAILSSDDDVEMNDTATLRASRAGTTRRSERTSAAAPAKITLRGIRDNTTVKRTPAQELFLLTHRNTKANKSNSIPPSLRLPELQDDEVFHQLAMAKHVKKSSKKAVAWDDAIMYFTLQDPVEVADSAEAVPPEEQDAEVEVPEPFKPLVRQATPNKPRLQRLKPPSKSTSTATESASQSKAKAFKSGIVMPGKRTSSAVKPTAVLSKIAQPGSRRKLQSRLPAPVTAAEISAPSEAAQPLLMSPPKKRASLFIPSFEPSNGKATAEVASQEPAGLSSPAKKPRRPLSFGVDGQGSTLNETSKLKLDRPTLSSPAKKKTRRIV